MALHKKQQYLSELKPDIAIVPECAAPEVVKSHCQEFRFNDADWVGENKNKGLGVFAFGEITLSRDECFDPRFSQYIPLNVEIAGKSMFNLLAVWSFNRRRKIEGIANPTVAAFAHYSSFLAGSNSIAAGDFNNCPAFDKPKSPNKMKNTVATLARCGLKSAYHFFNDCELGEEADQTHFWRKGEKEFHIDYCFVPEGAQIRKVAVGSREQWIDRSDHAPLVVDISVEGHAQAA